MPLLELLPLPKALRLQLLLLVHASVESLHICPLRFHLLEDLSRRLRRAHHLLLQGVQPLRLRKLEQSLDVLHIYIWHNS